MGHYDVTVLLSLVGSGTIFFGYFGLCRLWHTARSGRKNRPWR
jgi:hypothetical protein